jgi:ABC-type nitrate/sulfonate/bicarbonate transport system ATPase subunit
MQNLLAFKSPRPRPGMARKSPSLRNDGRGSIAGRNLSMQFTSKAAPISVLDELDIEIRSGEFLALLGPSGCGKSTLLNLFAGILKPTSGQLLIDDKPVVGPNPGVGIVFQHHCCFPG